MSGWVYSLLVILVSGLSYKLGWNKGVNDTLSYFQRHPIPPEFTQNKPSA